MKTNPVVFMIARSGLNRAEMTVKYGFGKNLLLRASQGRVQSITRRVANALWAEWEVKGIPQDLFDETYDTLDLDVAYRAWIDAERYARRGRLPLKIEQDRNISPFARLVKALGSVSHTAKFLCVADLPVQRYAEGKQDMPQPVREALDALGYPYTEELDSAQKKWVESRG